MKAGEWSDLRWKCPQCGGHDGEWYDCETHTEWECFVLRCDECDYESYDHDPEPSN